jgi:hypothetical protein
MNEIKIGSGPDFVVHVGTQICYHKATIVISVQGAEPYKLTASHQSMIHLIHDIKDILRVIQIRPNELTKWDVLTPVTGRFATATGAAAVTYTCPGLLPLSHASTLSVRFKALLDAGLSSRKNSKCQNIKG